MLGLVVPQFCPGSLCRHKEMCWDSHHSPPKRPLNRLWCPIHAWQQVAEWGSEAALPSGCKYHKPSVFLRSKLSMHMCTPLALLSWGCPLCCEPLLRLILMYSAQVGECPQFSPTKTWVPHATSLKIGLCPLALHVSCQQSCNKMQRGKQHVAEKQTVSGQADREKLTQLS